MFAPLTGSTLAHPVDNLNHLHLQEAVFGQHSLLEQLGADARPDGDEDVVYLSPLALGLAALLLLVNGLLSVYLSLGLHKTLGIAAVRQVPSLNIMPFVLLNVYCGLPVTIPMPDPLIDLL